MTKISFRVSDELLTRFDAAAALAGGRSALLRWLIRQGLAGAAAPTTCAAPGPTAVRLMVRLDAAEAAHVAASAQSMGLRRATWVTALVRRHALGRPTMPLVQERAVIAIQGEVHRIGVNVNQIARALNTAVLEGRVTELELEDLRSMQLELRAQLRALSEVFEGNLTYWATDL